MRIDDADDLVFCAAVLEREDEGTLRSAREELFPSRQACVGLVTAYLTGEAIDMESDSLSSSVRTNRHQKWD